MKNIGEMKLRKVENLEKKNTPEIPLLPTTIDPLATPSFEFQIPIGTDERSNGSCAGTATQCLHAPYLWSRKFISKKYNYIVQTILQNERELNGMLN